MTGFPILTKDELDSEQKALWDELTLGPRGFYTGGAEAKRAFSAMMTMGKIDVAKIEAAVRGETADA